MDAIDNRNLETLSRTWREYPQVKDLGGNPREWPDPMRRMVLMAMRAAGDQALFDSVTIRLERSFGTPPPELDRLREALTTIAGWKHDTLGERTGAEGKATEDFDRGTRMAFYRCADAAAKALNPE